MDSRSIHSGNQSRPTYTNISQANDRGQTRKTHKSLGHPKDEQEDQEKPEEEEPELLSYLDESRLTKIKFEFKKKEDETGDGLLMNEFLEIMLSHLEYQEGERQKISMRLIDLFKEIDVNGDQHLEWYAYITRHEFSSHIIELGMLKKDRTVKEIIKNYYPSDTVKLSNMKQKHDSDIEKVYYFEDLKNIITIERDSPKFQVYSSVNPKPLCDVQAHRGAILAAEVVKIQNSPLLATTSIDLAINFWDTQTFKLKQIISTPEIQQVLRYAKWGETDKDPELLYTGGNDAIIHIYDLKNFREKSILTGWNPFLKRDSDQKGHSGPIMDILAIKTQKLLATAALDGKICLWDVVNEKNTRTLGGDSSHLKGITCLDWYPDNNWLLSSGLDHDVFVFNTYVREKIHTLKGHAHPLVGVKCIPSAKQLITADISGMVKVWDVRTMLCNQSFNSTSEELHSFCVTHPKKRIVLGAKNLIFYDYDEPKDQNLSDEKICIKVIYNETLFMFVTLHSDSVKIWDARNGELKATHRQLTKGEFTSCCLDDRERKLFLGDNLGNIFAVNVRNGAILKEFIQHKKGSLAKTTKTSGGSAKPVLETNSQRQEHAITDLGYCALKTTQKVLVTTSECSTIKIHDDSESDPSKSRNNEMSQQKGALNSLSIKQGDLNEIEESGGFTLPAVVASASDDSVIMVTNLSSYRIEAQLRHPDHKPFKKVLFLDKFDVLVGVDVDGRHSFLLGRVFFFGYLEDRKFDYHCHRDYYTTSQTSLDRTEMTPISAIGFDHKLSMLILGDIFGNVELWNVEMIIIKATYNKVYLKDKFGKKKLSMLDKDKNIDSNVGKPYNRSTSSKVDPLLSIGSTLLTETYIQEGFSAFTADDLKVHSTKKRAHYDGITHIDVMSKYEAYATSSYDCCVCIWSIRDHRMLGALLIGGYPKWSFKVSEDERRKIEEQETKEELSKMEEEKAKKDSEKDNKKNTRENQQTMSKARRALDKAKLLMKSLHMKDGAQIGSADDSHQSFRDDDSTEQELREDYYEMNEKFN